MKHSLTHFFALFVIVLSFSETFCKRPKKIRKQTSTLDAPLISVVSPDSFATVVGESKIPVVLTICATGTWCALSHAMAPVIKQVATEKKDSVQFAEIHVDSFEREEPALVLLKQRYNVEVDCVPTSFVIVNNQVIGKLEEEMDLEKFNETINSILQKK